MSKIFRPYRSLGKVCDEVPFVLRYHPYHKEIYIIVPVGRQIHTYALQHLAIKAVSEQLPAEVTAVAANSQVLLVAAGERIFTLAFNRKPTKEFSRGQHLSTVRILLTLGNEHFLSVDEKGSVFVWCVEDSEPLRQLPLGPDFSTSAVLHPATYKNKVLLGSRQGGLRLWNVRRNDSVHDFTAIIRSEVGASDRAAVTCLAQGPAPHLVAVGRSDGRIDVLQLKQAQLLRRFRQEWGAVTSLCFRSDGVDQLLSGSEEGYVTLWRLETACTVGGGDVWHQGPVTGLQCVLRQPLVVSSSPDNRLKVWSYADVGPADPEVRPQVLYRREGHYLPPAVLRYFGQEGDSIVSGGDDSTLRLFSTLHERFNRQLGRAYRWTPKSASARKKQRRAVAAGDSDRVLPAFRDLAVEPARAGDWDTAASCHANELQVVTWDVRKGSQGQHHLRPKEMHAEPAVHKKTAAACVAISSCGSFCIIGYSSGHIVRFNVQSGLERMQYADPDESSSAAHRGPVVGIFLDQLDKQLTSAGSDARLRVWDARKGRSLRSQSLEAPAVLLRGHRDAGALALALNNGNILILEAESSAVIRRLLGHSPPDGICEIAFFPDAKWMVSFGSTGTVKTWDLMDGKLIDCFRMARPVRSAVLSPTADFLATAHEGDLGLYLWSNQALYRPLALTPLPETFEAAGGPTELPTASLRRGELGEEPQEAEAEAMEVESDFVAPEQLSEELVTLSGVPAARWRHLTQLDTIRERNRPRAALRTPKAAPFFLPPVGDDGKMQVEEEEKDGEPSASTLLGSSVSRLAPLLRSADSEAVLLSAITFLESLGPSGVDLELQLLGLEDDEEVLLRLFLHAVRAALRAKRHFDTAQGYLGLFLQHYGLQCRRASIKEALQEVQTEMAGVWENLQLMGDELEVMCLMAEGKSPFSE